MLKSGGLFYYSNESPTVSAMEKYEDKNFKITGVGKFKDKKSGKFIVLGRSWNERLSRWEMVPGMIMKTYHKTFRTQLLALRNSGFELIDFIDCKPVPAFKKYDKKSYKIYTKFPCMSIYVAKKK